MTADEISALVIPTVLLIPAVLFSFGKRDHLDAFMRGAANGLKSAVNLIFPLVLIMTAVSMLSASGATDFVSSLISSACEKTGLPSETLPLLLTRPFSGSAANGALADLMKENGADSFPSFCAAVIMGSSDTLFYVISVFFSAAKHVKYTRHTLAIAIVSSLFCIFFSCFVCRLMY